MCFPSSRLSGNPWPVKERNRNTLVLSGGAGRRGSLRGECWWWLSDRLWKHTLPLLGATEKQAQSQQALWLTFDLFPTRITISVDRWELANGRSRPEPDTVVGFWSTGPWEPLLRFSWVLTTRSILALSREEEEEAIQWLATLHYDCFIRAYLRDFFFMKSRCQQCSPGYQTGYKHAKCWSWLSKSGVSNLFFHMTPKYKAVANHFLQPEPTARFLYLHGWTGSKKEGKYWKKALIFVCWHLIRSTPFCLSRKSSKACLNC